ncbi:hypothetical protein IFM89_011312 [Coptis chinensis]|uniref:Uncharacterized protein n=1 Tax=Coptis chinensis TaxID=261450 RepID=A0A835LRL8_9MAGN|nr:hypothetical protein IFM89_011312 [Coptis chinensis]
MWFWMFSRDSIANAASMVAPAVVNLFVTQDHYGELYRKTEASGTIIDPDGTILTCANAVVDFHSRLMPLYKMVGRFRALWSMLIFILTLPMRKSNLRLLYRWQNLGHLANFDLETGWWLWVVRSPVFAKYSYSWYCEVNFRKAVYCRLVSHEVALIVKAVIWVLEECGGNICRLIVQSIW